MQTASSGTPKPAPPAQPAKKTADSENGGTAADDVVSLSEVYLNTVNGSDAENLRKRCKVAGETRPVIYSMQSSSSDMYDEWTGKPADDRDLLELQRASEEINRSNRRIMKQSFVSDVLIISDNSNKSVTAGELKPPRASPPAQQQHKVNPEEDDWDSMYDENGDCLDPSLWEELTELVGKVAITKPVSDYKPYQSKVHTMLSSDDGFAHVLEIYDFPAEFKTQDLLAVFAQYKSTGFEIKWVDDTHALAVFSSVKVAEDALSQSLPFVKVRPLREGTAESRHRARRCAEFLQPYKARPETCTALARRLVSGALGVKLKTAQEERERERRILKEAKERKLLATRNRDEAWEEDYSNTVKQE